MKRLFLVVLSVVTAASVFAQETESENPTGPRPLRPRPPEARPRLGVNLAGPADWNTELPFVNVFRMSRPWISQRRGARWGKGPALDLDAHGWVKRIAANCWAETLLCTVRDGHYPGGMYTVLYEGEGKLEPGAASTVAVREPGRMVIWVDPKRGGISLKITATNPDNYIRNIRVVMPGFEETYGTDPFHPAFLARWRGVACLRFMDWMRTNDSTVTTWAERPTPADATFSRRGVALEWMIDLANRLQADPWFCMPHRADDAYVQKFAAMVRKSLDPKRKAYIEYSNELWNRSFPQSRYASLKGKSLGFAEKPHEASRRYTAHRSVRIFKIWAKEFEGTERLVRVLSSQAANDYVSKQICGFNQSWRYADALAIAPYMSCNVPPDNAAVTTKTVAGWTVEQALAHMEAKALPQTQDWMWKQKAVADRYGLRLIAYEGGQHMVGVRGGENKKDVTKLFHAANRHPAMRRLYRRYLTRWTSAGGDLFCHYSSVSRWSKWGSWGLLEYADDDPARSAKFTAVVDWARRCGQPMAVIGYREE